MKTFVCFLSLLLTGCATTHKVSLREIQDYNQAIQIAEQNQMDTKDMHNHLVDLFMSYLKNPGEDPYLKAMKDSVQAQQMSVLMQGFNSVPIPQNQPLPMSPNEYHAMSAQWNHLPGGK